MLLILVLKSKPFIWYILHSFFMISCANHQMHKPLLWDFHGPPLHACRQMLKLLIIQYYAAGLFFFRNRTAIFSTQIDVRWHSALAPQDRRQRPTSCRCAAWLAPAWGEGEAVRHQVRSPHSSYSGSEPGVGQRPTAMEMAALTSPAPPAASQPRHRHKPHLYASIPTGSEPISTLKMQKS